jgi:hypothetical protein
MSTTPQLPTVDPVQAAVDALRDVHDEATLWHLADQLYAVVPKGTDFGVVLAAAKAAAVPTKSATTLRLYRDVASRFPAHKRVAGVSFSAHREALTLGGSLDDTRKLLEDLAAAHGAGEVTVTTVRKAVQAATGKGASAAAGSGKTSAAPKYTWTHFAQDVVKGKGAEFLVHLDTIVSAKASGVTLDGVKAGMSVMLAEIEARIARQAKADARRQAQARGGKAEDAAPVAARKPAVKKAAPSSKAGKRGDLRGI